MIRLKFYSHLVSAIVACVALTALFNGRVLATDSDVMLVDVNGQTTIGAANDIGTADENLNITTKVFQGVLIANQPPFNPVDYGRDEPGFFAPPLGSPLMPDGASALPPNARVDVSMRSFTVGSGTDTLFYWDGNGTAVDFQPISTAQPGVSIVLSPSSPLATTHPDSSLHQHSFWELSLGPDGAPVPADGVYLLSQTAIVAGLTESDPLYMLFLVDHSIDNEDDASALKDGLDAGENTYNGTDYTYFQNARDYVQNNLAVPEPSALTLVGVAVFGVAATPRRKRDRRSGR